MIGARLRRRSSPVAVEVPLVPAPTINLLPESVAQSRQRRAKQAALGASVAGATALVLLGDVAANQRLAAAEQDRDAATLREQRISAQVAAYAGVGATYQAVDDARATLRAALGDEIRFSRLLNALSTTIPPNVQITSARWAQRDPYFVADDTPDPAGSNLAPPAPGGSDLGTVTLVGLTSSYDDLAGWLETLNRVAGLGNARLLTAARVPDTAGVQRFTCVASLTSAALSQRYSGQDGGLR